MNLSSILSLFSFYFTFIMKLYIERNALDAIIRVGKYTKVW